MIAMMTRVIFAWQAPNSIASMVSYSSFTSVCQCSHALRFDRACTTVCI
jgi:hypothetical protein